MRRRYTKLRVSTPLASRRGVRHDTLEGSLHGGGFPWLMASVVQPPMCCHWLALGDKTKERGWARVRNALSRIVVGDYIVAALKGNRVGRIGQVTALKVQ